MPSSKQKNLTGPYACIQALYWMYFAAIMSFSGFFLLDGGFSNTQIGIIAAAAGIISALLQPVLASYADRPDSPSLKKLIQIFYMIQLLLGVGLFFSRSLILTGLLYGISIALLQLLTPFINALGMESINQGQQLNFGLARGMGSVAYAIICYVLGIITVKAGAGSIPASVIILTFFTLGCLILFPFVKTQGTSGSKASGNSLANPLLFFRKYKHFSLVLIGCIFIYLSHVLLNNFNFQIAQGKGGGSSEMGTASAIAAMCELPTLFLFGYIIKKIRCDILIRIAGIFFVLKSLGTLLAPGISVYYGVRILQMLGWGLMTAASVYYVNTVMEPEDAIKGQAYFTMTYTLGCVIGSFLGGVLIDFAGVNSMLIFATVSAFFGALIVFIFAEHTS